jgi:tRNA(Ile)-lysidine synthetase-like protein
MNEVLRKSIATIPPGRYAVAVSGGVDSVALLCLLRERSNLHLRIAHLDHQTRHGESAQDATFVSELASQSSIPIDLAMFSEIAVADRIRNRSAQFREARFEWFRRVVRSNQLEGVILAHHADDQAETILLRLIRGSGYRGLSGMAGQSLIGGLKVFRPLLSISKSVLLDYLNSIGQKWCEDQSNASPIYARNRARVILGHLHELRNSLLSLAEASSDLRRFTSNAPILAAKFGIDQLADQPTLFARESARGWLIARGAPPGELLPVVLDRLIFMASDAATPAAQYFPGKLLVRRRRGVILKD